jgi:methyl-accepting chemotaxis protein
MARPIWKRLSYKFTLSVSVVALALLAAGAALLIGHERRAAEESLHEVGANLALVLARSAVDPLLYKDRLKLDALVEDAKQTRGLLFSLITDPNGEALTSAMGSLNAADPAVKAVVARGEGQGPVALVRALRDQVDFLEVRQPVLLEKDVLGTVAVGLSRDAIRRQVRRTAWLMSAAALVLVVALMLLITAMFHVLVVRPLSLAGALAGRIADGDLTGELRVRADDEVGLLAGALNDMGARLRGTFAVIQGAIAATSGAAAEVKAGSDAILRGSGLQSDAVTSAASLTRQMSDSMNAVAVGAADLHGHSEHMASAVLEMVASAEEVDRQSDAMMGTVMESSSIVTEMSATVRQIAGSVDTLSARADEVVSSVTEMNTSIKRVEELAKESSSLSASVAREAEERGLQAVDRTRAGMERIQSTVGRSGEAVRTLGAEAEKIGGVLTVIQEVTDQTGLLALNAAILAAQAGDAGRGFGVVAAEIRQLADRTASSTKEIGAIIESVQQVVRLAVGTMAEGLKSVEEGGRLAAESDTALRSIIEKAGRSTEMSRKIDLVSREQAKGMAQIASAVEQISEMIRQIAAGTNQHRKVSEMILAVTERVRDSSQMVKRAMSEQATGGKSIGRSVEEVRDRAAGIQRATGEQLQGGARLVRDIEQIHEVLLQNAALVRVQDESVQKLHAQALALQAEMEKFRI